MKKYSILILAFVLLTFNAYSQPKIQIVGGDTYNWGTVTVKDDPLKAKIKIKNIGDQLLDITEVKPGCGCTTAPLDKTKLKPGETATMDVTLKISGAQNDLTKSITISSNDPVNPKKYMYIKAHVFAPISLSTRYLAFGEMNVGYDYTSSVTFKNNTKESVILSDIQAEPNNVELNLKNKYTLKPGEEYTLIAKAKPSTAGYFNTTVKVKTSNKDLPEISISGYGTVKASLFNK